MNYTERWGCGAEIRKHLQTGETHFEPLELPSERRWGQLVVED